MGDARYVAVFPGMGAGQDGRRSVGTRIWRCRDSPAAGGGHDVTVLALSARREPGYRRDEKNRMGRSQP